MKGMRSLVDTNLLKLLRFLLVGGSAAAIYALACTLLVNWLPDWRAAISIGVHAMMIPIAFFAQRRLTFRSSNPPLEEFAQYAGLQIASNSISTWALVRLVTTSPYLNIAVFLMIAGFAAIISYFICNTLIFSPVQYPAKRDLRRVQKEPRDNAMTGD